MTDLRQRIEAVLAQHRYLPEGECSCGHDSVEAAPENWGYHQDRHHDPHVIDAILAVLQSDTGREETTELVWADSDYTPSPRTYEKCDKCGNDLVLRHYCPPDTDMPRTHTDEFGRTWEWCGGAEGTWAWRVTSGVLPPDTTALEILARNPLLDGYQVWLVKTAP